MLDANRKIAGKTCWNKQYPHKTHGCWKPIRVAATGAENMVAGVQVSGLSFVVWFFGADGNSTGLWDSALALVEHVDGFEDGIACDFQAFGA